MTLDEKKYRAIVDGTCFMCKGTPVVAVSCYQPHYDKSRKRHRQPALFYGLCGDCMAEVADERTQRAALAAIETRANWWRSTPPWQIKAFAVECYLPREGRDDA